LIDERRNTVRQHPAFVLDAETGDVKSQNSLSRDEFCISTPVLLDNEIFLRTFDRLFCIESATNKVSAR